MRGDFFSAGAFSNKKKKERELRPDNNFIKPSDKKKNK